MDNDLKSRYVIDRVREEYYAPIATYYEDEPVTSSVPGTGMMDDDCGGYEAEDEPCKQGRIGYTEKKTRDDEWEEIMRPSLNYNSYDECLEFWAERGKIRFLSDADETKTIVYNLCKMKKHFHKIEFDGYFRGVKIGSAFLDIITAISEVNNKRIKSAKKFFEFVANTFADYYYENVNLVGNLPYFFAARYTAEAVNKVLKEKKK